MPRSDVSALITRYAELMREKGIAELEVEGLRIRFWSPQKPLTKADVKKAEAASVCKCGHALTDHTEGACWEGCLADKCNPSLG